LWVFKTSNFVKISESVSLWFYIMVLYISSGKYLQKLCIFVSEAHILNQLYIMVLYISFYGLKIKFSSKSRGVSVQFYQKCQFFTQINRNSVFLCCEAYIPLRLYIKVMYIFSVKANANTFGFWYKIWFFKMRKNIYTWILCITDPEYRPHGQKIWSLGQFLLQTGIFGKTKDQHLWILSQNLIFFIVKYYIHDHYV
jgi:hypothetical protein